MEEGANLQNKVATWYIHKHMYMDIYLCTYICMFTHVHHTYIYICARAHTHTQWFHNIVCHYLYSLIENILLQKFHSYWAATIKLFYIKQFKLHTWYINLQCCTQSYLKHRRQNKVLNEWSVSSFEQASAFGLNKKIYS